MAFDTERNYKWCEWSERRLVNNAPGYEISSADKIESSSAHLRMEASFCGWPSGSTIYIGNSWVCHTNEIQKQRNYIKYAKTREIMAQKILYVCVALSYLVGSKLSSIVKSWRTLHCLPFPRLSILLDAELCLPLFSSRIETSGFCTHSHF